MTSAALLRAMLVWPTNESHARMCCFARIGKIAYPIGVDWGRSLPNWHGLASQGPMFHDSGEPFLENKDISRNQKPISRNSNTKENNQKTNF